jgi:hypothetical protein
MNLSNSPSRFFRVGLFSFVLPFLFLFSFSSPTHGQFKFREAPNRQLPSSLSGEEGDAIWGAFLFGREVGRFALSGTLVHRPPGRSSESYRFRLEGDWSRGREHTVVVLEPETGSPVVKETLVLPEGVFLAQEPEAGEESMRPLSPEELHEPFMEGLPLAREDLLMPFLYWKERFYLGPDRYIGRPAHRFALFNPDEESFPAKVVVTVDEDYAALLKASLFDFDGNLVKRVRVGGFRKFEGEWMFSEIIWEVRSTRESVKLAVDSFSLLP